MYRVRGRCKKTETDEYVYDKGDDLYGKEVKRSVS